MVMSNADVAATWVKGLAGDWALLEALSSPTMRVWHSHDNMWLTRAEGAARMAEAAHRQAASGDVVVPPSFADVRAIATESGFVVQGSIDHLSGQSGRAHIVQICTVVDGLIESCEEFIAPEMPLG